jgi:hypothetical protein
VSALNACQYCDGGHRAAAELFGMAPEAIRRCGIREAGWDETALHSAIAVCCLFSFMNRLVDGHGIEADATLFAERGRKHASGANQQIGVTAWLAFGTRGNNRS